MSLRKGLLLIVSSPWQWAFGTKSNLHGPLRTLIVLVPWLGLLIGLSLLKIPPIPAWVGIPAAVIAYVFLLVYEIRKGPC